MFTIIRNRVPYSPKLSQQIADAAAQQRLAYNLAVEFTLKHPNVSKFDLQKELTAWRATLPALAAGQTGIQRPGLNRGRDAVRAFDSASLRTLKECVKELKLRQAHGQVPKRNRPKRANRRGRDLNTQRLFRSRRAPTILIIEDRTTIKLTEPKSIVAAGPHLNLAKAIPEDTDVRALAVTERASSRSKGRNRPLADRSYHINIVVYVPDPEPKNPWLNPAGIDVGPTNPLSLADGRHFHQPKTGIYAEVNALHNRQKRLKRGGRSWVKLQKQIRKKLAKQRHIVQNWEQHVAGDIAKQHSLVAVEDLKHVNMRASAKGTNENPGTKVPQKAGLNRSLSTARAASIQNAIERHCEKNGTWFLRVPAPGTSQTCPLCGFKAAENRKKQAEFLCQRCGLSAHADTTAAVIVLYRAMLTLTLMLTLWAHGPDPQAAKIRRRQGLPPLSGTLNLIAGRPGRPLDPSSDRERRKTTSAGGISSLEPKLSI